jgi:hypothetical protein
MMCQKKCYGTEVEARQYLHVLRSRGRHERHYYYHSPCGSWHLTSQMSYSEQEKLDTLRYEVGKKLALDGSESLADLKFAARHLRVAVGV